MLLDRFRNNITYILKLSGSRRFIIGTKAARITSFTLVFKLPTFSRRPFYARSATLINKAIK